MAEYLHPGVYVVEVEGQVRPIEGVSTSTADFLGGLADLRVHAVGNEHDHANGESHYAERAQRRTGKYFTETHGRHGALLLVVG